MTLPSDPSSASTPIPPESVPTGEVDSITDHAWDVMKVCNFPYHGWQR
jgi:hypothetical protein